MKNLQKKKPGRSTTVDQPGFLNKKIKLDISPLKKSPQTSPSKTPLTKYPQERPSRIQTLKNFEYPRVDEKGQLFF